jgi:hypothetical protein
MGLFQGEQRQSLHGALNRSEVDLVETKVFVVIPAGRNAIRS